ncbi:MAG: hypothetical protein MZU91_01070 [Desulfosudis oleivorans]|nr:hypothetical protein [Desulfosudis oleivorans]
MKKYSQLIEKGVNIPNPGTIDIGDEVNVDQISEKDVTIYPGCRIYGGKTVISAGCKLGYEAPVTIENCQLGLEGRIEGRLLQQVRLPGKSQYGNGRACPRRMHPGRRGRRSALVSD